MKLKSKIKALIIAISFTMTSMGLGQILLYRETTNAIISHCREINRQNISFLNLLSNIAIIPTDDIQDKTKAPKYCKDYISKETELFLQDLESYQSNDYYETLNISSEKIRLYADNYQILQNNRSKSTKRLLMLILVMNVFGLASMSIFLKYDSNEM